MEPNTCPICRSKAEISKEAGEGEFHVDCERCGKYSISDEAVSDHVATLENIPVLSYWIKKRQSQKPQRLNTALILEILTNTTLPDIKEQSDNFILWLAEEANGIPDKQTEIDFNKVVSVIGCREVQSVQFFIDHLNEKKLIHAQSTMGNTYCYLTFEGWIYSDELKRIRTDSRVAFMAMGYGKGVEKIYGEMKNWIQETGFELRRLDEQPRTGVIDNLMRVEIRKAKFLISDLTADNRGAYWEAGFAEGLGKEVIYVCEESAHKELPVHFDTSHCQTVLFEWGKEDDFKKRLKATIRATFPDEAIMDDKE